LRFALENLLAPYQLCAVSLKPFALVIALVVGMSGLADGAARQRDRSSSRSSGVYQQYPTTAPVTGGSYGGYSTDPHTRYLEELADKHRGGW
jgi:hypothetical protein